MTKAEYLRLLEASKHQEQLNLVIQTICGTGIRVSELKFFTVEAIRRGEVTVQCKSKTRTILVPGKLKKLLLNYAKKCSIQSGTIFITRNGTPPGSQQYMGTDETAVPCSECKSFQSLSPQSAEALCPYFLRH